MITIWKFPLRSTDLQILKMPEGAKLLHLETQHSQLCLWAEVNTDNEIEDRQIAMFGTGHPLYGKNRKFIGTVQMFSGDLIFHFYEIDL